MGRTRRYLLESFSKSFLLVFLPFLLIVSLAFLIQLSVLSSHIHLNTEELFTLFAFFLPEILFYTLPFSLLAALANTFGRLSEENEMIALFALGERPAKLVKFFLPLLLLFTAMLLVLSIMLHPQMKQKVSAFKDRKIAEATLKISPNKLSQNFGDYHVYVASKDEKGYKDIVLLDNHDPKRQKIFLAKHAKAENVEGRLSLILQQGIGETSQSQKIQTLHYRSLSLYQYPRSSQKTLKNYRKYWAEASKDKGRRGKMLYFILVSLSPILSFPLIVAFSIFNPRYQKNRSAAVIFAAAMIIYIPAALIQKSGSIPLFFLFSVLIPLGGMILLKKRILNFY